METPRSSGSSSANRTYSPREKHCEEMKQIAMAIRQTTSPKRKRDLEKRLKRMSHELKIYDSYHKGEKK